MNPVKLKSNAPPFEYCSAKKQHPPPFTLNGSVDRAREERGGPVEPSVTLVNYGKRAMTHAEASLDLGESFMVLDAIRQT